MSLKTFSNSWRGEFENRGRNLKTIFKFPPGNLRTFSNSRGGGGIWEGGGEFENVTPVHKQSQVNYNELELQFKSISSNFIGWICLQLHSYLARLCLWTGPRSVRFWKLGRGHNSLKQEQERLLYFSKIDFVATLLLMSKIEEFHRLTWQPKKDYT